MAGAPSFTMGIEEEYLLVDAETLARLLRDLRSSAACDNDVCGVCGVLGMQQSFEQRERIGRWRRREA